MDELYHIRLDNGIKLDVKGSDALGLQVGDNCVIRRDFFQDTGKILRKWPVPEGGVTGLPSVIRQTTIHDESVAEENVVRAKNALRTAEKFVEQLKLDMKLLNGHYSLDNKQLTIQFTADGRVDFRELVKELSHTLGCRIELRQIGVRDETAIFGGIGVCGQELCCCRYLREFSSINVRMAKEQDLSLTPGTISGACGRLKCCLKYEHAGYLEMEKTMPKRGDFCECPEGPGRICDRNVLTREVSVLLDSSSITRCSADDVKICRDRKRPDSKPQRSDRPDRPDRDRPQSGSAPKQPDAPAATPVPETQVPESPHPQDPSESTGNR